MIPMTVEQLYEKLCSKAFQDTQSNLFYNFFVYLYQADKEFEMREQIDRIKDNIKRPVNNVDVLTLDIFEEFCQFMDKQSFGKHPSYLEYILDKDRTKPDDVTRVLQLKANSDAFMKYLHDKIMEHVNKIDEYIRPYVFMYGLGNIYPYLRTSNLLNRYEPYNRSERYKIILFYPGDQSGSSFNLFGDLEDNHTYRAIVLMNE